MKRIKVLSVFGTRPEAIKMAPLIKELEKYPEKVESVVCVTAQHREMLDSVLQLFDITPEYDLDLMKVGQTLTEITSEGLVKLERVIKAANPALILVHGDTTTTFVASLAAFYQQIPVGHVEAGLRTCNKYSPFPEEINRQLAGVVADLHFAPTQNAVQNLLNEGKKSGVYLTGNTVIDTFVYTLSVPFTHPVLDKIGDNRMILLTTHRRENHGLPMKNIFNAVLQLLEKYDDLHIVFPVHPNPLVANLAAKLLGKNKRINMIKPLDVVGFHHFMSRATLILTDSGGIQEEAPTLGIPVLVLRDTTERPEGVTSGATRLVGTRTCEIVKVTSKLLEDKQAYSLMVQANNPYGDGQASSKIVQTILEYFKV